MQQAPTSPSQACQKPPDLPLVVPLVHQNGEDGSLLVQDQATFDLATEQAT